MAPRAKAADEALAKATAYTWEGTRELVGAILEESKFVMGWRPMRAAALLIKAEVEDRLWMAPHEFGMWRQMVKAFRTAKNGEAEMRDAMSWEKRRVNAWEEGETIIPKVVALACAHYIADMPFPSIGDTPQGFDDWMTRHFGGSDRISRFLNVPDATVQGYRRRGRAPKDLIRAMDWTLRTGGACPYGVQALVKTWPRQEV